ncbi:FAD-dependent 5-carboxymethylaminomethyl-2-thiouridine(34) oxidoreductase MnmC [Rugamonas apoptosis]|uniref:FAD-dependent 5-carboxymethylaminomethyl-2-thiouridine(34) oxidoreductase MnmC n=1 Tax=Rugamonas apoptosis TaxID=2758570 RepID=A0A7W2F5E0_9BURK|nr:FAD-dependent 5-carboxymethylaminomethyl-2-thiouridine(34) oxidoreductase MnmC [Rugamonas apoptosis]MBA5685465.1 FAD-dependent 5-carboxymethylaminomethyl-2-thiouridine(34) oxidoreductase MnmC [Rugamonas apoptosis]
MSARHVVLATDFGDGAHFMATWAANAGVLHYIAIAPQPPAAADITDPQLRALWSLPMPGTHRIVLDDGRVTLDLMVGTLDAMLPQVAARVQAFYLPAAAGGQPAARTLARALAGLAAPGATLQAQAPDEALVWALTAAGFVCEVAAQSPADSVPDIRAVYASRSPQPPAPPEPVRRAVVIGAGVAGSALCERLCARGWEVALIERHDGPAQEASGNHAGIFMPLLSKDDNIPTRLTRTAYLFALREWQRMGGVGQAFKGASCGVLQLARDADHARVQREVVEAGDYPSQYVRWLDAPAASDLLGSATPHGGWLFEQAGWARPSSLCETMLAACGERLRRVFHAEALTLARVDGEWQVRAADGALLAQAPTLILANGTGATRLAQAAELPLSALRGQVTHLTPDRVPALSLVVCREGYVTPPSDGVVCAGATYGTDEDPALRPSCHEENLARLADMLAGVSAAGAPLAGRVGFRCAAPDRLPLAGPLPDYPSAGRLEQLSDVPRLPGLYGLLGYASRGLIWAPLMAEFLVSQLEHTPLPMEASLAAALDPGRFLLKERRRSQ